MATPPLKLPLFLAATGSMVGSFFGLLQQSAQAQTAQSLQTQTAQPLDQPLEQQMAQAVRTCQFGGFPRSYVRIKTSGSPLRVRSAPAGNAIGLIPDGWAVRVLEWSRNGYWVRVTSHFDVPPEAYGRSIIFGSAPDFQEGWVSAGYVEDAGRTCEKPDAVGLLLQPEVFGAQPVQVQGDWLAMGDQLGQS